MHLLGHVAGIPEKFVKDIAVMGKTQERHVAEGRRIAREIRKSPSLLQLQADNSLVSSFFYVSPSFCCPNQLLSSTSLLYVDLCLHAGKLLLSAVHQCRFDLVVVTGHVLWQLDCLRKIE